MSACAFDARGATTTTGAHGGWADRHGPAVDESASSPSASAPLLGGAGGERTTSQRAALNRRYAIVGVVLVCIACAGFYSAIAGRLSTGVWYRDPVLKREKPIPLERLGPLVGLHALTGSAWLAIVAFQVITIALAGKSTLSGDELVKPAPDAESRYLRWHRALGKRTIPPALLFSVSALVLLVVGKVRGGSDPEGGYNTWFVRWVEFGAVALAWFFYVNGMTYIKLKDSLFERYPHLMLTPSVCVSRHKDCMLASIFFAAVPTGLPRLLRDVLQMRQGVDGCNLADSAPLFFSFACLACVLGIPLMLLYIGGRSMAKLYMPMLAWYATVVIGSVLLLRPDLALHCSDAAAH